MIGNPVRFFIDGSNDRRFTYEGGTTLFHWSPYESGLSDSMESNVIFFANDVDHGRDVLRRMFEFWIDCNERYVTHKQRQRDDYGLTSSAAGEIRTLRYYLDNLDQMKIVEAPTNQFYQVGWACNDTLNVYQRPSKEKSA